MDKNKKIIIVISVSVCIIVLVLFSIFLVKYILNKKDVNIDTSFNNNIEENSDNNTSYVCSYFDPIIPEGFESVETKTASWKKENGKVVGWNNGLVIKDKVGNEFVWVPAGNINLDEKLNMDYGNKEYDFSQEEINQIKKYGGFYVARYEAGITDEMIKNIQNISYKTNDVEGIPVSKKGVIPWNYITLKNAIKNAQNMYSQSDSVYSDLISTRQELYIAQWLKDTGIDIDNPKNFGNFVNSHFKFTGYYSIDDGANYTYGENVIKQTYNMILSTGASDYTITNNIYDLAGNVQEFTNTFDSDRGYCSVGGYYSELEDRMFYIQKTIGDKTPLDKLGFRVVLYLK